MFPVSDWTSESSADGKFAMVRMFFAHNLCRVILCACVLSIDFVRPHWCPSDGLCVGHALLGFLCFYRHVAYVFGLYCAGEASIENPVYGLLTPVFPFLALTNFPELVSVFLFHFLIFRSSEWLPNSLIKCNCSSKSC